MKITAYLFALIVLTLLSAPSAWALEHNFTAVEVISPVSAGRHSITIDATPLASGTYFVEMVFKDASGNLSREIQPVTVRR